MTELDPRLRFRDAAKLAAAGALVDVDGTPLPAPELGALAREVAERFKQRTIAPAIIAGAARLIEFAMLALIGFGVFFWYVYPDEGLAWHYVYPLVAGSVLTILLIQGSDGYTIASFRTYISQLGRIFGAWTMVFAFFATILFFAKVGEEFSRVWFMGWYLGGLTFFTLFRTGLAVAVRGWTSEGRLERRAVIVGGGKTAEDLIVSLENQPDNDIRICGIFDDRSDERSPDVVAGYPKLGTIAELVTFARMANIDLLIVAIPLTAEGRVGEMLKKLWVLPVDICLSAHTDKLRFRRRSYQYVGAVPFLDVFNKPIANWDSILKRCFDLVFATLAIIGLSPVMIATAIAIRAETKGPIIFRQKRYGFNNEPVEIFKFRSMYQSMTDARADRLVTRDDPRVTKVGRFIRKTSIDELPQLFNVIRGDLSLVGPRPHAPSAKAAGRLYETVVDGYYARHRVKPGITGWAQINGYRGETDTSDKILRRVEHDLYYIENWSLLFDLYILVLTPFRLFNTEHAY
ncbi:undecaprenyl-phosphate glucose phosphotransferase [Rhodobium gokarnense]|uniref:Undecaprenyl-phosphate glucose phosphotransferase n=1 Tax=Rhodobium gokarnense TaxID=364296 RepID=A0ABT3HHU5_9HYPH|nr:undecaprenyl-phosphate glucose phosphotransferase [Rhodobium gokarnense]MCW2309965.1 Undecaprenyl-phosphate glucose phosphotransferase [Rhodobium gokarnense]